MLGCRGIAISGDNHRRYCFYSSVFERVDVNDSEDEKTFKENLAAANRADDELQYEHDGSMVLITYILLGWFGFGVGFFIGWVVFA